MSDPQHLGLGELGQRLQAMGDPAPQPVPSQAGGAAQGSVSSFMSGSTFAIDSRLRPYQGAPLPVGPLPASNPASSSGPGNGVVASPVAPSAPSQSPMPAAGAYPGKSVEGLQPFAGNGPVTTPGSGFVPTLPSVPKPQTGSSAWEQVSMPASGSTAPENELNPLESIASGQPARPANSPGGSQPSLPASSSENASEPKSGLQRALNAVRSSIPFVQSLLPLLEGNFANAIGALMSPQHSAPPPVKIDMEPVERGLAEVRNSNRELRTQMQEQGTTLKRVEDQLERVREATDRNTLEQQELVEDLRTVGSRISTFAIIGVVILLISLGMNVYFLIELQHILR